MQTLFLCFLLCGNGRALVVSEPNRRWNRTEKTEPIFFRLIGNSTLDQQVLPAPISLQKQEDKAASKMIDLRPYFLGPFQSKHHPSTVKKHPTKKGPYACLPKVDQMCQNVARVVKTVKEIQRCFEVMNI